MNLKENIAGIISQKYAAIRARRAKMKAEIAALVSEIAEIALHLEGLQQEARSSYVDVVADSLGMKPGPAAEEARKLRQLAKRPVDKTFFVANGMLPAPPRKAPKASKPSSPIVKVGNLQAEILAAKERGLNAQEAEVIRGMIEKLLREL
ncbi:hypothetical protein [Haloferula sp. BvORR071]|uniref:hypothetical protein n=1 Tax=Haloferula sp. BvORR071 TaxID=1396141 RepID=UPI000551EBFD|nr:hypothetical protein [Haloferula sp. BvORR071]